MTLGEKARDRPVLTAVIGATGVVLAAVVGIVGARIGGPGSPSPSSSPIPSSSPSQGTASGPSQDPVSGPPQGSSPSPSPTSELQRLLSYLPQTVSNCTPTEARYGALVGVVCAVTPGTIAVDASVNFFLYDDVEAVRLAFQQNVPAAVTPTQQVCPDGPDRSDYHDERQEPAGQLACWVAADNGAPYIVWTTDVPSVMATVGGPVGATPGDLWPFWLNTPIDLPE